MTGETKRMLDRVAKDMRSIKQGFSLVSNCYSFKLFRNVEHGEGLHNIPNLYMNLAWKWK